MKHILIFLAKNEKILDSHIDLLWAHSIGKHESVVTVVHDSMLAVIMHLSRDHLEHVLRLV